MDETKKTLEEEAMAELTFALNSFFEGVVSLHNGMLSKVSKNLSRLIEELKVRNQLILQIQAENDNLKEHLKRQGN